MTQLSRPLTTGGSSKEAVKVIVRCRPLSKSEIEQGHQRFIFNYLNIKFFSIITIDNRRGMIEVRNPKDSQQTVKCFTFDSVYDSK